MVGVWGKERMGPTHVDELFAEGQGAVVELCGVHPEDTRAEG